MFEIGVQGGPLQYPSHALDTVGFSVAPRTPDMRGVKFGLANLLAPGFAVGGSVTVNTLRYFSTEFTFTNQRGKYRFGTFLIGPDSRAPRFSEQSSGLMSRQFQYNLLVHLRPRETRLRPYFAVGSALQLIHLTSAPVKRSDGPFRYGLKNIGMVRAAYNFGSAPPLEGGGIFQLAFQYGAGIKYRIHPRWLVRLDFRETIGRQPNFFSEPTPAEQADAASVTVTRPKLTGAFRQQRVTAGFAFTF
jgi:opacity protein-like surface antigen